MQPRLTVLCALALGSAMGTVYIEQSAIATETRYQPPSVEQSIPSLPGKLALSKSQQENIVSINRELSQQIKQILTDEQLKQFLATMDRGFTLKFALQELALSPEQSNQLGTIIRSARKEIEQVLTPEQLDYIIQQKTSKLLQVHGKK